MTYFSGTKNEVDPWRTFRLPGSWRIKRAERASAPSILGVYSLTEGVYVTDVTNASGTMLFDIHKLRWTTPC